MSREEQAQIQAEAMPLALQLRANNFSGSTVFRPISHVRSPVTHVEITQYDKPGGDGIFAAEVFIQYAACTVQDEELDEEMNQAAVHYISNEAIPPGGCVDEDTGECYRDKIAEWCDDLGIEYADPHEDGDMHFPPVICIKFHWADNLRKFIDCLQTMDLSELGGEGAPRPADPGPAPTVPTVAPGGGAAAAAPVPVPMVVAEDGPVQGPVVGGIQQGTPGMSYPVTKTASAMGNVTCLIPGGPAGMKITFCRVNHQDKSDMRLRQAMSKKTKIPYKAADSYYIYNADTKRVEPYYGATPIPEHRALGVAVAGAGAAAPPAPKRRRTTVRAANVDIIMLPRGEVQARYSDAYWINQETISGNVKCDPPLDSHTSLPGLVDGIKTLVFTPDPPSQRDVWRATQPMLKPAVGFPAGLQLYMWPGCLRPVPADTVIEEESHPLYAWRRDMDRANHKAHKQWTAQRAEKKAARHAAKAAEEARRVTVSEGIAARLQSLHL